MLIWLQYSFNENNFSNRSFKIRSKYFPLSCCSSWLISYPHFCSLHFDSPNTGHCIQGNLWREELRHQWEPLGAPMATALRKHISPERPLCPSLFHFNIIRPCKKLFAQCHSTNTCGIKDGVVGRLMAPKDIPGTCECYPKRNCADAI